jgi:glutathione synthase/RimK-type ligase-like ATP-grasp enzyme
VNILLIVDRPEAWPLELPGVEVLSARRYLTDPSCSQMRRAKVFNLCRSYRYQSAGYYVSLLAQARGHRPLPDVVTIQDLRNRSLLRTLSDDLDDEIQRSLAPLVTDDFSLSVYFGRNLAQRHSRLARQLFNAFPAPLLRAQFRRREGRWEMQGLRLLAVRDVPDSHREFLVAAAGEYFARPRPSVPRRTPPRFDLAILQDPEEEEPPSDEVAIRRFVRAGEAAGFGVELIEADDFAKLAEFDALFIRETTAVNHYTYRFARRAEAEGLVVIDDPESIIRCSNKVFLAEVLERAGVPTPRTRIVDREGVEAASSEIPYPCILKLPDSSFSQGVVRADDREAFLRQAASYLESSDLLIVQEFVPTEFDWRVGVLDREALYACRYHMARGHWQIIRRDGTGRTSYGRVQAVPLGEVPEVVLESAGRAAAVIGDGLYGVDLKHRNGEALVVEVNDNPSIDGGYEDAVLGDELYRRIMGTLLARCEKRVESKRTR